MAHHCIHKNPPLVIIMSQTSPVHTTPTYLLKICLASAVYSRKKCYDPVRKQVLYDIIN
jgi:hypothetical protein